MLFRPSIKLTLMLVMLAFIFMRLGLWQLERKAEKQALFDRFDNAPTLSLEQAILAEERFAHVEGYGRYDTRRHILLDNKIWQGRAGVHVLTPFTLSNGKEILINRGWLPLPPDRRKLPDVPTTGEPLVINGILESLPSAGHRIGEADVLSPDHWPQLITYFDTAPVSAALGTTLAPWLVKLDAADSSGFEGRQWEAAVMEPKVHGAYALQWFALAIASIIIWIALGIGRAQALNHQRVDSSRGQNGGKKAE